MERWISRCVLGRGQRNENTAANINFVLVEHAFGIIFTFVSKHNITLCLEF